MFDTFDANSQSHSIATPWYRVRKFQLLGVGVVILIVVVIANSGPSLESVVADCSAESVVQVSDDGKSVVIDGSGDDVGSGSASVLDTTCILTALGAPDSVFTKMTQTRALDGLVSESWGHWEASWTYHPDNGLDVLIERAG